MKDFDWIIEHKIIPDLDINMSFDGVELIVPTSLCVVEYNGVIHLEMLPKKS